MRVAVQQSIHFDDAHPSLTVGKLDDVIACADLTFVDYPAVKAGAFMTDQEGRHFRDTGAKPHLIAGNAGLRDFKDHGTDLESIPNTNGMISQLLSVDREVLAELTVM